MSTGTDNSPNTRMIFMGDSALTDGFQLIGFETHPNAGVEELDQILRTLVEHKQNALVILDSKLSASDSKMLKRVRAEGGRIVVTQVPPLNNPSEFHCEVDSEIQAMMGIPQ